MPVAKSDKRLLCVSNPVPGTIKPAPVAGFIFITDGRTDNMPPIHPSIDEFMKAVKSQNPLPYKLAKLRNSKTEQFIEYYYWSLAQNKYIRTKVRAFTRGVKSTKEQRLSVLKQTLPVVNEELKRRNDKKIYHETLINPAGGKTYTSYIQTMMLEKKLKTSTRKVIGYYKSAMQRFQGDKPYTPINVTIEVLEDFRDFLLEDEGKANKTINDYLWAAQLVSEYLKNKGITHTSVNTKGIRLKKIKNQTMRYRPLTFEEKDMMFSHFRTVQPYFYLFLLNIYYTCIRPSELRRLQIKQFNLSARYVTVPWFDAKNGLTQQVQLLNSLLDALTDYNIVAQPKDNYLFSQNFEPGKKPYKGRHTSDIWRTEGDLIGLSKDAKMYALKHTFNLDYVENNKNNIDWEWLRRHNRHATQQQTQDYIYNLTPYMLDETKSTILNYYTKL